MGVGIGLWLGVGNMTEVWTRRVGENSGDKKGSAGILWLEIVIFFEYGFTWRENGWGGGLDRWFGLWGFKMGGLVVCWEVV